MRFPITRYKKGSTIVSEGTAGEEAFYVHAGRLQVFRVKDGVRHDLTVLGPGDVFGETAVFTGQVRNASVEALVDVELYVVPGRFLADALGLDSWMGAFVRSLGVRIQERSQRVTELEQESLRADVVARALVALAKDGELVDGGLSLPLPQLLALVRGATALDETHVVDAIQTSDKLKTANGRVAIG
jgi:serine/threonine-protein kinase